MEEEMVETFVGTVISTLSASVQHLEAYRDAQAHDAVCARIQTYCQTSQRNIWLHQSWQNRNSLMVNHNLLLFNHRIVVPAALWRDTLQKIHKGHQGIE